jgi:hypothetical protein
VETLLFFLPALPGVAVGLWLASRFSAWWLLAVLPAGVASWFLVIAALFAWGFAVHGKRWNPFM